MTRPRALAPRFAAQAAARAFAFAAWLVLGFSLAPGAVAQGAFSPAITVNDRAITGYELTQRERLLRALGTPGDLAALAREQLIDDRLRQEAVERAGLTPGPEAVADGITEFAGRADLTAEAFLARLAEAGVARETMEDFVRAGLGWRELVRTRFGPRSRITEGELDRALSATAGTGSIRVLLSELILPAPPQLLAQARADAERVSSLTSFTAFEAEARALSAAPSRERGGRIDWLPLNRLPPAIGQVLLSLAPGEVTPPFELDGAIALFQLRAVEETQAAEPEVAAVEYAVFTLPDDADGRAEAALLAGRLDTCDDLYGAARGLPEDRLIRQVLPPAEVPADIAVELARLDAGETSLNLARDGARLLVMLCDRTTALNEGADREDLRLRLRNERLSSLADSYLAELRAGAVIVED